MDRKSLGKIGYILFGMINVVILILFVIDLNNFHKESDGLDRLCVEKGYNGYTTNGKCWRYTQDGRTAEYSEEVTKPVKLL